MINNFDAKYNEYLRDRYKTFGTLFLPYNYIAYMRSLTDKNKDVGLCAFDLLNHDLEFLYRNHL